MMDYMVTYIYLATQTSHIGLLMRKKKREKKLVKPGLLASWQADETANTATTAFGC